MCAKFGAFIAKCTIGLIFLVTPPHYIELVIFKNVIVDSVHFSGCTANARSMRSWMRLQLMHLKFVRKHSTVMWNTIIWHLTFDLICTQKNVRATFTIAFVARLNTIINLKINHGFSVHCSKCSTINSNIAN